jgi:outer membrane lipoprotein LolB
VLSRATGLVAGFIWLFCAGCSTLRPAPHDTDATFYAHGRLSVHYRDLQSGKEDTVFGRFDWVEHGSTVDLSLLDPLGQSIAIVHSEPGRATLKLADGRAFEGDSAEDLTQEALGYTVPIAGLRSWLLGHAEDPALKPSVDADGAVVLHEMNWTVKYPDATVPPKRMDLSYPGPGVALDLRLALEAPDAS